MRILTRYLLGRMAGPLAAALALLCGLIFALQVLRLGHHILGGGLGAGFGLRLLLYSLPSLAVFCLPLALAAAVLFVMGRMAAAGELEGMALAGRSPLQICAPAGALSAPAPG